jgi:hypothetical protein
LNCHAARRISADVAEGGANHLFDEPFQNGDAEGLCDGGIVFTLAIEWEDV